MIASGRGARVAKVVRQVFGLAELRPGQQSVIEAVLAKRHTLAIMPTGAGKSLCYQVPLLESLGETAEWSACGTCDNCRGLAVRSTAAAAGAA